MSDFPAFETFPTPTTNANTTLEIPAEPRKRGPRRDIPGDSGNHMPPQKRKGGRPKKVAEAPTPAEVQDPTIRLFQASVGLQHEDLQSLTAAYQALLALNGEARLRVLGILNKVFA